MATAMDDMGEAVSRLVQHLPGDEFSALVTTWDAACREHLKTVSTLEDRVDELTDALRSVQRIADHENLGIVGSIADDALDSHPATT